MAVAATIRVTLAGIVLPEAGGAGEHDLGTLPGTWILAAIRHR